VEVTVVVATFGDSGWETLARERAIPSAERLGVPVVHTHAGSLSEARNAGLGQVRTDWVCHLDADDELEAGYFDRIAQGRADVRAPAVRYVQHGRAQAPRVPRVAGHTHVCRAECLVDGNWLVIGSVARTELLRAVGGHLEFDWSEDWSLWLRCHLAGASFEAVPRAVYRAHVRQDSRNRGADRETRERVHHQIARAHMPWRYTEASA
jgi:hypothetical protein